jgi:hypothetical protein
VETNDIDSRTENKNKIDKLLLRSTKQKEPEIAKIRKGGLHSRAGPRLK